MNRLAINISEYDPYYKRYIEKLPEDRSLLNHFEIGKREVMEFFLSIPEDKLQYRYAPNKWNCKEIYQHLIDTERIFMHRCFRIARRDTTPLAGFDQNIYINPSGANQKTTHKLMTEFMINRNHSISLLESLTNEDLKYIGNANGGPMSARAAAFVIPGHNIWHIDIIKERYL